MMDNNTLLNRASELAIDGNRTRARQLVLQAIDNNKHDVEAWWALANLAESDKERERAMSRVLTLDPDHPEALHMRDKMYAGTLDSLNHPYSTTKRDYRKLRQAPSRSMFYQETPDYTGKAVMTLVAYIIVGIIGLAMNIYYLNEARRVQRTTGVRPQGIGCLYTMLAFVVVPIVVILFITFFGILVDF